MESSLTSELLQCAICLGDLENAHALPCLHSFCALCLQNHISTSQKKVSKSLRLKRFPCPTCRVWINSPGSGLFDFPRDFRVVRLRDVLKEWKDKGNGKDEHTCCMCDKDFEDPVDNFCADCQKYLCTLCFAEHKTTSVLSNHVVFSVSSMHTEKENSKCSMHSKEPIKYHCETCNMGICVKCIMGEHKDHDVMDNDNSCKFKRVELRNCMSQLRNHLSHLNEVMFDLASTEGHVKSQHEQTNLQIRKHSHKVINYVYHEQSRLLNEADKDYQVKYEYLSQRRETCKMHINQFTKLQSRLESLLRVQDINTISENFKSIVKDVQDIEIMEKYSKKLAEIPKCAQFVSNGVAHIGKILPGERTTELNCGDLHKKYSHLNQDGSPEHEINVTRMKSEVKNLTSAINGTVIQPQRTAEQKQCLPMATLLSQIGGNRSKHSQLGLPYGISFSSDEKLVVGENGNERIQIFSKEGQSLKVIPLPGCCPRSLCSSSDQMIVFTDETEKCLKKVNLETCLVSSITARYTENTVSFPFGVAALSDERFVISDMIYETVSITSSAGIKEKQIGGDDCGDGYDNPSYLATDSEDNIFIADSGHHKIKVYDKHGRFLFHFGDDGIREGQLRYPKGIAVDKNGLIFVADAGNDRVVVFSRLGFFLTVLSDRNSGIERPTGLAYSPSGLLAVSMPDKHEVFVYQLEDSISSQF
ncbi:E3 ubiquitin-protein ligase TRIM71-like [Saccostrea echinata]|uniref:E3 ubiquitin-protein ligase TRIM71-like n=1 Tax=Saccostrea echinata TaxID=191078 RepID=UPI002A81060A|nr:E3 ubiquitin-protein ligase TRIM71-like [Saccostrea echinata]